MNTIVWGVKLSEFAVASYDPLQYPVVSSVKMNWLPLLNLKLGGLTELPFPGTPTTLNAESPLLSANRATENPVTTLLANVSEIIPEEQSPAESWNLNVALEPDFTTFWFLPPVAGSVNGD